MTISTVSSSNFKALPRYRITSTSTECLRRKCPFFGKSCFVHGARARAEHCDIVVTNHSLLFWDARFEHGLLPPIRYWVVDEAHNAEDEARRAFSTSLSSETVKRLIRTLTSDSSRYNPLIRAEREQGGRRSEDAPFNHALQDAQCGWWHLLSLLKNTA